MFWLIGLLGVVLILAPFVLNYRDDANAQWSHVILGVVILVAAVIEALDRSTSNWEYWVAGVAGVVADAAPFLFNFRAERRDVDQHHRGGHHFPSRRLRSAPQTAADPGPVAPGKLSPLPLP